MLRMKGQSWRSLTWTLALCCIGVGVTASAAGAQAPEACCFPRRYV